MRKEKNVFKKFLFSDLPGIELLDKGTSAEFLHRLQAGDVDLAEHAHAVLEIATTALDAVSDYEMSEYVVKGRGADFTAVQLLLDPAKDDMLRLHLFPRAATDTELHRHSRRVISSIMSGVVRNTIAFVEMCDFEERDLDVWDCTVLDGVCVPKLNTTVGACLCPDKTEVLAPGSTYEVPVDQYHKISVPAGTATMCWFAKSRTVAQTLTEGRVIKPRGSAPTEIAQLDSTDLMDIRQILGGI